MHENSGVCQVTEISEMALTGKGSEQLYYSLTPVFQKGSKIFTPVEAKVLQQVLELQMLMVMIKVQ